MVAYRVTVTDSNHGACWSTNSHDSYLLLCYCYQGHTYMVCPQPSIHMLMPGLFNPARLGLIRRMPQCPLLYAVWSFFLSELKLPFIKWDLSENPPISDSANKKCILSNGNYVEDRIRPPLYSVGNILSYLHPIYQWFPKCVVPRHTSVARLPPWCAAKII